VPPSVCRLENLCGYRFTAVSSVHLLNIRQSFDHRPESSDPKAIRLSSHNFVT
jgi:hypothetical protein